MNKVVITLMFFKSKSIYGEISDKLISWWTNGNYSHVEIAFTDNSGKQVMWSARADDVLLNGSVSPMSFIKNNEAYDYLYLTISEEQLTIIKNFLNSVEDDYYDRLGILGFILPLQDRTSEWFCSELVSNCLKIIGFPPMWKLEPSKISPNKLHALVSDYLKEKSKGRK